LPSEQYPREQITGVVLAGGRSTRMGGADKGLIEVAGRPMAAHVLDALRPQVAALLISANRNPGAYRRLGAEVVEDRIGGFAGPLAGIASAMEAAATGYLLVAPCDSPLVAADLGERLWAALRAAGAEIAVAHDGERLQPVFALLATALREPLLGYLEGGGRKIDRWYREQRLAEADLADRPETFLNVNAPADRERLEALLGARVAGR